MTAEGMVGRCLAALPLKDGRLMGISLPDERHLKGDEKRKRERE